MVWFILALVLAVIGIGFVLAFIFGEKYLYKIGAAAVTLILGGLFLWFATFWSNGVGEAKVFVNAVDRTVVNVVDTPASGFKEPWVDYVDFDTFNQEVVYAGGDTAPSYTGGTVNGKEITVSVGGVAGGSTRANIDATFIYNVNDVEAIYREFKSQERFTKMVIEKQILSVARTVPSDYTATEFRGPKRPEAEASILKTLNDRVGKYGVEFMQVSLQDVRYPEAVETALTQIEQANQAAQTAEAEKRTAEVQAEKALIEAQGKAAVQIEQARAEAAANRERAASLTPELVELRKAELLVEASKGGGYIIDNGDGDLLLDNRSK